MKINSRFKIVLVILTSYFTSLWLIKNVFLASSPRIRPNLHIYLASKIKKSFSQFGNYLARLRIFFQDSLTNNLAQDKNVIVGKLKKQPLKILTKGVYARTDEENALIEIDTSQMDFVEYSFDINGKIIKVKIPKDQSPPDEKMLEALYR